MQYCNNLPIWYLLDTFIWGVTEIATTLFIQLLPVSAVST